MLRSHGKSITMFLVDGDANGLIKATISNWNGIAYKIPRSQLENFKNTDIANYSSVYFLFGSAVEDKRHAVYIGQAGQRKNGGGILQRLTEHDKSKDFWTDAIVFSTSNNYLGATELSYLENRFCNSATDAGRYEVLNAVEPTSGNITEEKESELEEYYDFAKLVLGVFGYKVFDKPEKIIEKPQVTISRSAVPPLPSSDLKIGAFVKTAMTNLSESGYSFSDEAINNMCDKEWSHIVLGLN